MSEETRQPVVAEAQVQTVEEEAAGILERMVVIIAENLAATEQQREYLEQARKVAERWEAAIAEVNANRDALLAKLETEAQELGLQARQTIKTEHGTIKYRKGALRITYNAKDLDAVAKLPEHVWLLEYRTESQGAPSVTVIPEG